MTSPKDTVERRRSARKQVLETFHVFVVIPNKGLRKIYLKDVSEGGLGFFGEASDGFRPGDALDCHFYINPSLRLPLRASVAHVSADGDIGTKVGCEFSDTSSRAYKTFVSFVRLLDELVSFVD